MRTRRILCLLFVASLADAQNYTVAAIRATYNAGRYTDVVRMVESALAYHPKDAQYPMLRGFAYAQLQEHALAVNDFTAVLELMPNMSAAHKWRGDSYKAMGNVEAALRDYNRAVGLDPYLGRDIYAVSAELYLSIGDTARSADHLARFMNLKPDKLLPPTVAILPGTDSAYAAYVVTHVEWSDTTDWRLRLLHAYLLDRTRCKKWAAHCSAS